LFTYCQLLLLRASRRQARVGTCDGVFALERRVLAQVSQIKNSDCGLSKVGSFYVGPFETGPRQDGVGKDSIVQTGTFEGGSIHNGIRKIGTVKVAV
jgi:hypothetical protein